ncbi:protocadherin beta-12 [Culicoides brevitarsis]|uniref:protocadherin beta-12 n=1 Tax=Culicoides brevitarsis TaxID=469753 RepID=UPI00307C25D4
MWILTILHFLGVWIKIIQAQSPILDSRCFLSNGGSAESFLVSEDIAVGTIIGTLTINGNPNIEKGNIDLSLRERNSPVQISQGTKDLVLITPLDKEAQRGPASVYVNVICDRRHTNDPSFVIPVNIRVTDVNDNAPQWVAAPYILTLSEVTVPGTRILQGAHAVDEDQPGPYSTIEYHVLQGPFSDYVQFVSPLEGTLVLKKSLDYEVLKNFTVKLRAQDQGSPPKFSDTTLRVIVIDADDQNPKFLKDFYTAELLHNTTGQIKIYPEPIKAIDQDEGIKAPLVYSIKPSYEAKYFSIDPVTGIIRLISPLASENQNSVTLVIKATQLDNADRYALVTLTLSNRKNNQPIVFLHKPYTVKVKEDLSVGSRIFSFPVNREDRKLTYKILEDEQSIFFEINNYGELILKKQLDYEKSTLHAFSVGVFDGIFRDKTDVTVEVIDVNDWEPRFRQTYYNFVVPNTLLETMNDIPLGKLEAADGDKSGQKISMRLSGAFAFLFKLDFKGMLWYIGRKPNVSTVHFLAIATDSGSPPKSTTVPVSVSFEMPNEAKLKWAPGVLKAFTTIVIVFILVIIIMSTYIHKQRKPESYLHNPTEAEATHEYIEDVKETSRKKITIGNPMNTYGGSNSSISAGASTILAASLEREAKKVYDHNTGIDQGNCICTKNDERDGFSDDKITSNICWVANDQHNTQVKNINFDYSHVLQQDKVNILTSVGNLGNSENNLTVYF